VHSCGHTSASLSDLRDAHCLQFNFRIPPYYTLLVRSLTVLEGIALASNPDYKVRSLLAGRGGSSEPHSGRTHA